MADIPETPNTHTGFMELLQEQLAAQDLDNFVASCQSTNETHAKQVMELCKDCIVIGEPTEPLKRLWMVINIWSYKLTTATQRMNTIRHSLEQRPPLTKADARIARYTDAVEECRNLGSESEALNMLFSLEIQYTYQLTKKETAGRVAFFRPDGILVFANPQRFDDTTVVLAAEALDEETPIKH